MRIRKITESLVGYKYRGVFIHKKENEVETLGKQFPNLESALDYIDLAYSNFTSKLQEGDVCLTK